METNERTYLLAGAFIAVLAVTLLIARDLFVRPAAFSQEAPPATLQIIRVRTPTPRPELAPAPTLPAGYRWPISDLIDSSWEPDGERFIIPAQPYRPTGERIGSRCRIELFPSIPNSPPAYPWIACAAIGG